MSVCRRTSPKILAVMPFPQCVCIDHLQNVAALKALFEKEWESILGNCDEFLYLGGNETSTTKLISESYLGKSTIEHQHLRQIIRAQRKLQHELSDQRQRASDAGRVRMLDNRYAFCLSVASGR